MIRPAKTKDAKEIASLVLVVLKEMELPFVKEVGEEKTIEILTRAVEYPTYRYGYLRGIVKEIDGEVAGVAFGYKDSEEPLIDQPLEEVLASFGLPHQSLFLELETYPDEWYLDTIVVKDTFRGRGVGAELIEAASQRAKAEGAPAMGLCVDLANPRARSLYERCGFEVVGTQVLSGHDYYHMQRKL